jgi:hypothetical protein
LHETSIISELTYAHTNSRTRYAPLGFIDGVRRLVVEVAEKRGGLALRLELETGDLVTFACKVSEEPLDEPLLAPFEFVGLAGALD